MAGGGETVRRAEPPVGAESGPFWEATREQRLVLQWCTACGQCIFYPRSFCPYCGSSGDTLVWRDASGRGTVYTVTVEHRPTAPFADGQPYAVALVDLDEGVRMLANVVGCPPGAVEIGMAVAVAWEPLSDGRHLPVFAPVP